jgi:hypothetical protein
MVTTIQIDEDLKDKLDKLKVHHRETYNDLIKRITDGPVSFGVDVESLKETVEVLSDPILLVGLKEALGGKDEGISWEKIKKDLKLHV